MLTLGQKIKAIRKEKGLTQAELVGDRITRNQLSLIENGINNPSISTLEFIAQRLNVPMSYFLSNDDFSLHKCQKLIIKAETLLESGEYDAVINEAETFLTNIGNQEDNNMGGLLGRLYLLLGIAYYNVEKSKAEEALSIAVNHLEATDQISYLSKAYNYLGLIYDEAQALDRAEAYLSKANNLISNVNLENVILKLNIALNLSNIYLKQKRYAELVDFINENLKYSKKYKIFHNFGTFNMLLSAAYRFTCNYKQAILCTLKAIEYFQFSDNEVYKYTCYINLGIYYRLSGDYENAIKYLDMAKKYFEYTEKNAFSLNAKSEILKTMFLSEKNADNIYKLANDLLYDLDDANENRLDILVIKAVCLLEHGDIEEAYKLFVQAEELVSDPAASELIAYIYLGLSKIYKHKQNWEKAYLYLDKSNALPQKPIRNIEFE